MQRLTVVGVCLLALFLFLFEIVLVFCFVFVIGAFAAKWQPNVASNNNNGKTSAVSKTNSTSAFPSLSHTLARSLPHSLLSSFLLAICRPLLGGPTSSPSHPLTQLHGQGFLDCLWILVFLSFILYFFFCLAFAFGFGFALFRFCQSPVALFAARHAPSKAQPTLVAPFECHPWAPCLPPTTHWPVFT